MAKDVNKSCKIFLIKSFTEFRVKIIFMSLNVIYFNVVNKHQQQENV